MILSSPNLILLDEPLAGIDPMAIQDVKNLVQNLKKKRLLKTFGLKLMVKKSKEGIRIK